MRPTTVPNSSGEETSPPAGRGGEGRGGRGRGGRGEGGGGGGVSGSKYERMLPQNPRLSSTSSSNSRHSQSANQPDHSQDRSSVQSSISQSPQQLLESPSLSSHSKSASAAVTTSTSASANFPSCLICAFPIDLVERLPAFGECGHKGVCSVCFLRYRTILKKNECPTCTIPLERVICATSFEAEFNDFTIWGDNIGPDYIFDHKSNMFFPNEYFRRYIEALFSCRCTICSQVKRDVKSLKAHYLDIHKMQMCMHCIEQNKFFPSELKVYSQSEFEIHTSRGDGLGSLGHPQCELCKSRFYDREALYAHLCKDHYKCHLCEKRDESFKFKFYSTYEKLEAHFRRDHMICEDENCLAIRFVAFDDDFSFADHQLRVHRISSNTNMKRPNFIHVPVSFSYGARTGADEQGLEGGDGASINKKAGGGSLMVRDGSWVFDVPRSNRPVAQSKQTQAFVAHIKSNRAEAAIAAGGGRGAGSSSTATNNAVNLQADFPSLSGPTSSLSLWLGCSDSSDSSRRGGSAENDFPSLLPSSSSSNVGAKPAKPAGSGVAIKPKWSDSPSVQTLTLLLHNGDIVPNSDEHKEYLLAIKESKLQGSSQPKHDPSLGDLKKGANSNSSNSNSTSSSRNSNSHHDPSSISSLLSSMKSTVMKKKGNAVSFIPNRVPNGESKQLIASNQYNSYSESALTGSTKSSSSSSSSKVVTINDIQVITKKDKKKGSGSIDDSLDSPKDATSSQSTKVPCMCCGKLYFPEVIQSHTNLCFDKSSRTMGNTPTPPPSNWASKPATSNSKSNSNSNSDIKVDDIVSGDFPSSIGGDGFVNFGKGLDDAFPSLKPPPPGLSLSSSNKAVLAPSADNSKSNSHGSNSSASKIQIVSSNPAISAYLGNGNLNKKNTDKDSNKNSNTSTTVNTSGTGSISNNSRSSGSSAMADAFGRMPPQPPAKKPQVKEMSDVQKMILGLSGGGTSSSKMGAKKG